MTMRIGGADEVEVDDRPQDFAGLLVLAGLILALGIFAGWSWAFIVVAIIFMIFIHELGHFVTAKLTGMKVTEFFIGFGPRIWSIQRGETEYGVKLIPAGAYVRIIGMNNLDPVEPGDEDRAYSVKSFPRKLLVISAGSLMHFTMALVLVFMVFAWKGEPLANGDWVVDDVSAQSAAAQLGIESGDELLTIDGIKVRDFDQFAEIVIPRGGQDVEVEYLRDGQVMTGSVVLGMKLSAAGADAVTGLIQYDRILAVEGTEVFSWDEIAVIVGDRVGEPIEVFYDPRGSDELKRLDVTFTALPPASVATEGFFGVGQEAIYRSMGFGESLTSAPGEFGEMFSAVLGGFGDMLTSGALPNFVSDTVTGDVDSPVDNLGSDDAAEREVAGVALDEGNPDEERIISIYGAARIGSQVTQLGMDRSLILLAFLNISIGILNLIPLPPLDGGHIAVASYERIRSIGGSRYEVDYNRVLPLTYAVFVLLIGFGLLAVFRDIIDPINLG
ncbi:MAG: site-2 protease family protein [Acidimicrobiales bacterium]|jgi:RIP metalloprotease RseP|nr:site-2 protease family protein [Acidimicrobiales bacterium]